MNFKIQTTEIHLLTVSQIPNANTFQVTAYSMVGDLIPVNELTFSIISTGSDPLTTVSIAGLRRRASI
jgi:hypothetical protein